MVTTPTAVLVKDLRAGRRRDIASAAFAFALWACLAVVCAFLFFMLAIIV